MILIRGLRVNIASGNVDKVLVLLGQHCGKKFILAIELHQHNKSYHGEQIKS